MCPVMNACVGVRTRLAPSQCKARRSLKAVTHLSRAFLLEGNNISACQQVPGTWGKLVSDFWTVSYTNRSGFMSRIVVRYADTVDECATPGGWGGRAEL